jgi:hypothetical protein
VARSLLQHFEDVVRILSEQVGDTTVGWEREPEIEERDDQIGRLAFGLRYHDDSTLHVELWADCSDDEPSIRWLHYSFHYQNADETLRFRYDNAPHHGDLPTFPHHLCTQPARALLPQAHRTSVMLHAG